MVGIRPRVNSRNKQKSQNVNLRQLDSSTHSVNHYTTLPCQFSHAFFLLSYYTETDLRCPSQEHPKSIQDTHMTFPHCSLKLNKIVSWLTYTLFYRFIKIMRLIISRLKWHIQRHETLCMAGVNFPTPFHLKSISVYLVQMSSPSLSLPVPSSIHPLTKGLFICFNFHNPLECVYILFCEYYLSVSIVCMYYCKLPVSIVYLLSRHTFS